MPATITVREIERERERAFEDGGYLESGPSLENRIQEEEFQERDTIEEQVVYQTNSSQKNELIEEDDEEARSPYIERRSWQRPRYTLSTIYENSLSRVEGEDHSFVRTNTQHHCQSDTDELSSEARSIGHGSASANKENWGFLEPEIIGSCQKNGRKDELYSDSDSKNGSRNKPFGSASKIVDTRDNDLVFVGSTPSKSRRILTTIDPNDSHQTSIKKYGLKLEF